MQVTWNLQLVKKENKSIVFNLIMKNSPISRADIAQKSGLNKGTVSSLVAELLGEQLIYESGPGESSGGRRPVMLLFNQNAGFSIGIDLGVNYILGVLTDLNGTIIEKKIEDHPNHSFDDTLERIKKLISYLIKSAPSSPYGVIGIGIGIPGFVDKEGFILIAPNLGWKNVSIKDELKDFFTIPVIVDNEANGGAFGEKEFGVGKNYDNLIYISAGIGIGAGIIINGELYKGNNGYSGEIGHMTINCHGTTCRCGNIGCWELYASERSLLEKANEQQLGNISLEEIIEMASHEQEQAVKLLEEIGENLGSGLVNIIHIFNPEQIIIGNRLAAAKKWLEPNIHQVIKRNTISLHKTNIQIDFSDLTLPSTALGVSAFSIVHFLKTKIQN